MSQSILRRSTQAARWLITLAMFSTLSVAQQKHQDTSVDLSILEQRDALISSMSSIQRVEYLRLEVAMQEAKSDLRSGHNLASTKRSALDPNHNIAPIIARGKKLIETANQKIADNQREMALLLMEVEVQKHQQEAIEQTKFDYSLLSLSYQDALATQCRQLLETCWEKGYETLFYDGVFIQDSAGTHRADAEIRNSAYDTLIKIDGTMFSVTLPVDFKFAEDNDEKTGNLFSYDNAALFKDEPKALLVIEWILPKDSSSGLLSCRAIDLDTQLIIAHQLVKVTDLASALGIDATELKDGIAEDFELRDPSQTLEVLGRLAEPYNLEIYSASGTSEVSAMLTQTLIKNANLQITDNSFLKRSYADSLNSLGTWIGCANARFTIGVGNEDGSYQLNAQAAGSTRVISSGVIKLHPPENVEMAKTKDESAAE